MYCRVRAEAQPGTEVLRLTVIGVKHAGAVGLEVQGLPADPVRHMADILRHGLVQLPGDLFVVRLCPIHRGTAKRRKGSGS